MRLPSTFSEFSFNCSFLRTTPARKPRTECACHPVACIIAAIVVPAGDCSIAITRPCLDTAPTFFPASERTAPGCAGFVAATRTRLDLVVWVLAGFFAGFRMGILHSVRNGPMPHRRSPISARKPAGRDPLGPIGPELDAVPLQSPKNASHFWILLLPSVGVLEHR